MDVDPSPQAEKTTKVNADVEKSVHVECGLCAVLTPLARCLDLPHCTCLLCLPCARGSFRPQLEHLKAQLMKGTPHAVRLAAPKCRFCGERVEWGGMDLDWDEEAEERGDGVAVGADVSWCMNKTDLAAVAVAAVCVCGEEQCRERLKDACTRPIGAAPAIRLLSCGHVVHAACAMEKIRQSYPGPEISFGFLSCPLCPGTTMEHPALQTEIAAPLALKQQVEGLAEERVKAGEGLGDGEEEDGDVGEENGNDGLGNGVLAWAMRRLLFFLCSRCHRPYFGGDRRCGAGPAVAEAGNEDVEEEEEGELMEEVEEAAKQKAAAEAAAAAAAAAEERERREQLWEAGRPCSSNHGQEAVQYKCQFCCSVATYFCGGTTHYCAECHQTLPNYRSSSYVAPRCTGGDQCPLRVAWHPQAPEEFCLGRSLPPVPSACCPAATWSTWHVQEGRFANHIPVLRSPLPYSPTPSAPLALKQQVEGLAEERVKAREGLGDGEEENGDGEEANGNDGIGNGLLAVALHRLLFFLCSCCHRS
ncbi:unnamed protein product [Closterium sp. Naga37s-1]|nr:unnamed protein product [Closterium sp. Naga37s-1]